jgi:hypothetical protein
MVLLFDDGDLGQTNLLVLKALMKSFQNRVSLLDLAQVVKNAALT